ncbi:MAG: hypothetical protein V3W02_00730 [Gammaproteobacteria bacterium]
MTDSGGTSVRLDTQILAGVVACFVLSGFAALLYQTAWMRQFSLVFGTCRAQKVHPDHGNGNHAMLRTLLIRINQGNFQ